MKNWKAYTIRMDRSTMYTVEVGGLNGRGSERRLCNIMIYASIIDPYLIHRVP
ncbi:MAG: hypothetical protein QXQ29_02645 [Candidatus Bathyarchaeia archaeon]